MTQTLTTKVLIAGVGAMILALASSPAVACIGEPPPLWERLLVADGPPVIIGRVAQVTRNPEARRTDYFEMWDATAIIRPVDTLQGQSRARYDVTAVGEVVRLKDGPMFCADRMALEPGDLVFGYERPDGSLRIVEPHQIPERLRPRFEAAQ